MVKILESRKQPRSLSFAMLSLFKFGAVYQKKCGSVLKILVCLLNFVLQTQGKNGCRDLKYLECYENKTLTGHVIDTFRMLTPALENCQNRCYHDNKCVSYNLGPLNGLTRGCELNAADHSTRPSFLANKTGHEYCPIQNPCLSNPCQSERLCTPDFAWDTYNCDDGAWTQWGRWKGERGRGLPNKTNRTRTCTSPAPQNNGASCDGPATETKSCTPIPEVHTTGCSSPLGMEDGRITDNQITATTFVKSSTNPTYFKPSNGRLNKVVKEAVTGTTYGGWAAGGIRAGLIGQHIQVDLGITKVITMVATQGREDSAKWVTKYSLSYSHDGNSWENYQGDCVKIFPGNTDKNTIVTNKLEVPIKARYIRLIVKAFHSWAVLRMELYGC